MGKFGIGARVRDADGDPGVITGKPEKGWRTVEYDESCGFSPGFSLDKPKSELTAIEPDDACAETCEVAYKVGDRVVFSDDLTSGVGVIVAKSPERGFDWSVRDEGGDAPSFYIDERFLFRTRHFSASDLRPFRLGAGRYYKTRDGRKVFIETFDGNGLNRSYGDGRIAAFTCRQMESDRHGGSYAEDGIWLTSDGRQPEDIVAEWVEPEADLKPWKVDAVPETPPVPPTPTRKFKVGDRVNYIGGKSQNIWQGVTITRDAGTIYLATCPKQGEGGFTDDMIELAAPAPKFKVGDRVLVVAHVNYRGSSIDMDAPIGSERTIVSISDPDGGIDGMCRIMLSGCHRNFYTEKNLELAAPTPLLIGQAVTATGYISGANGNNFSVVFGDKSYDLPATSLTKAA